MAERLVELGARNTLVAGIADAGAVHQCVEAGVGARVRLEIGGKLDTENGKPFSSEATVLSLSGAPDDPDDPDGSITTALIRVDDVNIILTVERRAFTERAQIAAAGINAESHDIIVVKQGYLFADLAEHAALSIFALSPGATNLDLKSLKYKQLKRPIYPLDPDFQWEPGNPTL